MTGSADAGSTGFESRDAGDDADAVSRRRWQRIAPLLDELLEMEPGGRRGERVRELAGGDPEIERELGELLEAGDAPPRILARPLTLGSGPALPGEGDRGADARIGRVVGGYRLVERLGQGGMATVYRGVRQEDSFDHEVAVKLVRPGPDSAALLGRFRDEQRILSSLGHPNIARFFGGGATDDAQPYIVMELVEGEPLDAYCDRRRLGVEERLELFRQVCRAVEHAHGRLVVHRDLKPSNLLVADDGTVKVLDFGIAKLLAARDLGLPVDLTAEYGVPLTPEFAAPEQLRAEAATTATDVYALGVVLFDLLAGSRPFSWPSWAGLPPLARARKVLETDPDRPSTRVTGPAPAESDTSEGTRPSAEEVARRRSTTPRRLRRRLEGDLDTIVLQALRREPERRYPSVAALREDVERHLADQPIRARPETWAYIAGRFVRRNRVTTALAVLLLLSLVLGLALALAGREAARREASTSERVVEFLVDAFRTADPNYGESGDVRAIDIVDRGVEKIRDELAAEPEVRARLLRVLAESSRALGEYERAEELARESVRLYRGIVGADGARTLAARNVLATVLRDTGRVQEAEVVFRDLLEREGRLRPESPLRATVSGDYGMLLMDRGDLEESEAHHRTALAIHRRRGAEGETEVVRSLNNLALVRRRQGDMEGAEAMLREILQRLRARGGPSVDVATVLNNLGSLVRAQGDLEGAEAHFREALELRRSALGDAHPDVAQSLNNVGAILYSREDFAGAARHFEEAVGLWERHFAGDHPRLAAGIYNTASLHRIQGRRDEAVAGFERAAGMQERLLGPDHPDVARVLRRWGTTLVESGRADEAIPLFERAVDILSEALGEDAERTREATEELAAARGT